MLRKLTLMTNTHDTHQPLVSWGKETDPPKNNMVGGNWRSIARRPIFASDLNKALLPQPSPRPLLFSHGVTCGERQWALPFQHSTCAYSPILGCAISPWNDKNAQAGYIETDVLVLDGSRPLEWNRLEMKVVHIPLKRPEGREGNSREDCIVACKT